MFQRLTRKQNKYYKFQGFKRKQNKLKERLINKCLDAENYIMYLFPYQFIHFICVYYLVPEEY